MSKAPSGEHETFTIRRYWLASRADGRKALILEAVEGKIIAFELPQAILQKLAADLASLSAQTPPPNTPNA